MKIALALALLLAACSTTEPPEGKPLRFPQSEEQCRAQPELDWC